MKRNARHASRLLTRVRREWRFSVREKRATSARSQPIGPLVVAQREVEEKSEGES